jgi:hypothetical protein
MALTASFLFSWRGETWTGVAFGVAVAAATAAVAARWSRRRGWGGSHRLALAGAALLHQAATGFLLTQLYGREGAIHVIGNVVFAVGAAALLLTAIGTTHRTALATDTGVTGSCVVPRLDRVQVANGIAVVLPLLLEDHVQAGEGGLPVPLAPRVLARRGQLVRCDGAEEVAHHGDATRPDLEHVGVRRGDRREDRHVQAVVLGAGVCETEGVERLFDLQDRPAQPCVRGKDQVPQRLRE